MTRLATTLATLAVVAAGLAGCGDEPVRETAYVGGAASPGPVPCGGGTSAARCLPEAAWVDAGDSLKDPADYTGAMVSASREDSVYPEQGDPVFDALHYDLHLSWDPEAAELDGEAAIAFRATADSAVLRLDLASVLEVSSVTVDGKEAGFEQEDDDLVVARPVRKDGRHVLRIRYRGVPEPTEAPTTRPDFNGLGWTVDDHGQVWTMQEPYGAFTWYPVNDQPADKALYDFRISAPEDWVGIANGELRSQKVEDGRTVTEWHLESAASSYLVTIAIGDYVKTEDRAASGVPLTYWTLDGDEESIQRLRHTKTAVEWAEKKLGPYPFSTLGSVVVDSASAMETQTMITYGDSSYTLSPNVIVHEVVHHWYGNITSPLDWSDVWMNEGMALYLAEGVYYTESTGDDLEKLMDAWADAEAGMRADAGPPGDYDPEKFAEGNIYYGPALMWHELRTMVGEEKFWAMVRAWPTVNRGGGAPRQSYLDWIEKQVGRELTPFFEAWLLSPTQPPRAP